MNQTQDNPVKLLLVEDDPDQQQLIRETLEERFGVGVAQCVDRIAAALALDLSQFDVILTDFNLPDGSGMDLLQKIRAGCSTPVIMVTGENIGQTAAEAIRKGANDYVVKSGDYLYEIPLAVEKCLKDAKILKENETLRREREEAVRELREKNAELEKSLKLVEALAATDPLTGLYNRRHFNRVLEQMFAESERTENDLSCLMIDLDNYKKLNDTYGHAIGDQLLSLAGKVISANLRKMDVAARYGGDEFVVLLPCTSCGDAEAVSSRIAADFTSGSASILHSDQGVTMSMGVASRRVVRASSCDHLMARADVALYRAKAEGRNRAFVMHGT